MPAVRGLDEVVAWLEAVHPEETRRDPASLFLAYIEELPTPLLRVLGDHLTPEERGRSPTVRERRRRYAATQPESLALDTQRVGNPALWTRTVGTGQDEEVEEHMEDEMRHDAWHARSAPADSATAAAPPQHTEAAAPAMQAALASLSADETLARLHRTYLDEIDADGTADADPSLLAEFEQAVLSRFVQGQLDVSYACDYDDQ